METHKVDWTIVEQLELDNPLDLDIFTTLERRGLDPLEPKNYRILSDRCSYLSGKAVENRQEHQLGIGQTYARAVLLADLDQAAYLGPRFQEFDASQRKGKARTTELSPWDRLSQKQRSHQY